MLFITLFDIFSLLHVFFVVCGYDQFWFEYFARINKDLLLVHDVEVVTESLPIESRMEIESRMKLKFKWEATHIGYFSCYRNCKCQDVFGFCFADIILSLIWFSFVSRLCAQTIEVWASSIWRREVLVLL